MVVAFSVLAAQSTPIPDEVTKVATAAGNWLKLENDARAIGMGGAFVAAGKGVGGIPYNPASVAFVKSTELYYSKTNYLAGITYNILAYGMKLSPTDFLGLHLFYLDSGDMDVTTLYYPDGTGELFSDSAISFRVTFAKIMTDRLKIGLSLKYFREKIYTTSMQSVAIDIGSNFDTGIYGFILGMSVSNFGPEVQFQGEGLEQTVPEDENPDGVLSRTTDTFPIPLSFRLGVKNDLIGLNGTMQKNEEHRLTFAIDGVNPLDYTVTGNVGLEYAWHEMAFLRMGTHLEHDTAGLSLGCGATMGSRGFSVTVDYAFSDYGILKDTHQFSLILGF